MKSSRLIIVSAITLIFIQLLTDIYLAIGTAGSRSYGGAYTIGLVMLIIGAALLISAVIASRSQAPPTQP